MFERLINVAKQSIYTSITQGSTVYLELFLCPPEKSNNAFLLALFFFFVTKRSMFTSQFPDLSVLLCVDGQVAHSGFIRAENSFLLQKSLMEVMKVKQSIEVADSLKILKHSAEL